MLNLSSIRATTPGCNHHIHFNNAGASLPDQSVLDTVNEYLSTESIVGGYELMAERHESLEKVYHSIAKMINASRNEIALFQSATAAWAGAFNALEFSEGDEILCSEVEYGSNYLNLLRKQKSSGINIRVVPSTPKGCLDVDRLEEMMNPNVKLIAITHVPTNGGLVNPAAEIGKIAKKHNCLYLLDACQSVGQMPIDVKVIGCDFLAVTGRKYLRAPRGTGFLFVSENVIDQMDPTILDLYSANWLSDSKYKLEAGARRFELFENNKALQLGLGKAVENYLELGPNQCYERIKMLAQKLRSGLTNISGLECTDIGEEQCGIITFRKEGIPAEEIKTHLFNKGVYTSVSFPSGTLLDSNKRNLDFLVRASLHYYNSEEEINRLLELLAER